VSGASGNPKMLDDGRAGKRGFGAFVVALASRLSEQDAPPASVSQPGGRKRNVPQFETIQNLCGHAQTYLHPRCSNARPQAARRFRS